MNTEYWLSKKMCYWNVLYHTKHHRNKRNHKQRLGIVIYKHKAIYGEDEYLGLFDEIPVRKFHYGCGHSWTETNDGKIIDWVINDILGVPSCEQAVWSVEELNSLGFMYVPYKFEKGIKAKVNKEFKCNCKDIGKGNTTECNIDWARNRWEQDNI